MASRVSFFFFLIGGGLLFLFVLSDISKDPQFNLLIWGGLVIAMGMLIRWFNPPPEPPPPSSRFRMLRQGKNKQPPNKKA
jgi:hypothetical protein